jgi:hypothetical protein
MEFFDRDRPLKAAAYPQRVASSGRTDHRMQDFGGHLGIQGGGVQPIAIWQ